MAVPCEMSSGVSGLSVCLIKTFARHTLSSSGRAAGVQTAAGRKHLHCCHWQHCTISTPAAMMLHVFHTRARTGGEFGRCIPSARSSQITLHTSHFAVFALRLSLFNWCCGYTSRLQHPLVAVYALYLLRGHCATSRKVGGSIYDRFIYFFLPHDGSGVDSASNKWVPGVSPGGTGGRCVRLTTLPPPYADCLAILGPRTSWSLPRACPGL